MNDIVDDAIAEDIYVIIDWHILSDGNSKTNYSLAAPFFAEMSQTYGGYPNVLFEICVADCYKYRNKLRLDIALEALKDVVKKNIAPQII